MNSPPLSQPALAASLLPVPPSPELLPPVADVDALAQPANIARPALGQRPRRMSVSETMEWQRKVSLKLHPEAAAAAAAAALAEHHQAHPHAHTQAPMPPLQHQPPPLSRPNTAERDRRARTRFVVPMSAPGVEAMASETFSIDFAPDSRQMAIGCGDGSVRLFGATAGTGVAGHRLQRVIFHAADKEHLPATCVRFSPVALADTDDTCLLLAAYADGSVTQWCVGRDGQSDKPLRSISTGAQNSVYALAIQSDGLHFVAAGRDHVVRLYDANTGQLVRAFDNTGAHGHSNRVYALKWHPRDAHTLLSGGWDNTVQFWDDRTGTSVRSLFGPHLCGDALDINSTGSEILTGSWREDNALQRWDFASGKLITNVTWQGYAAASQAAPLASLGGNCMLYCASYSPDDRYLAAGGAGNGVNQCKLFDAATNQPTERVTFAHGLYAMAFAPDNKQLALGGVDTSITIVNL